MGRSLKKSSDHLRRKMARIMTLNQKYKQVLGFLKCQKSCAKTKRKLISTAKPFTRNTLIFSIDTFKGEVKAVLLRKCDLNVEPNQNQKHFLDIAVRRYLLAGNKKQIFPTYFGSVRFQ